MVFLSGCRTEVKISAAFEAVWDVRGTVPVPDLVFLLDCRAEVKISAASEAIWDARRVGSGAGFGFSFGLPDRSRDFSP